MEDAISTYAKRRHYKRRRGFDQAPVGTVRKPGRFGRMFSLPALQVADEDLVALGGAMVEPAPSDAAGDNAAIPAGYAYLSQFIDHDISFDTMWLFEQPRDRQAIFNLRMPQLELDGLYGGGPSGTPHLYQRHDRALMAIGLTSDEMPGGDPTVPVLLPFDLPRMAETGFAVIGDPRNDENLVVAQTHLAFLKFHNAVVTRGSVDFETARKLVRWHYQWIVLHDFVRRIVDPAILDDVLANGRSHYHFDREPFIPVEFAVAAYRLGHSMMRDAYDYNRVFRSGGVIPATPDLLFEFSGLSGNSVPIPSDWIIDWRRFYEAGGRNAPSFTRLSRKINPLLALALQEVPGMGSLAVANLRRGARYGLPSGQAVAEAMGMAPLPAAAFDGAAPHPDAVLRERRLDVRTPLWYYILKEAEVAGGQHLGPVGSRIVAEVFVGLLDGDPESFRAQNPLWQPILGARPGMFAMADLLEYVGELNPLGGD